MPAGTATGEEGVEEEEEEVVPETEEIGQSCGRRRIGRSHVEGAEVSPAVARVSLFEFLILTLIYWGNLTNVFCCAW